MRKRHAAFTYLWEHAIWFNVVVFMLALVFLALAFWPFRTNEILRPIAVTFAATLISIGSIRVFYETFASQSLRSDFTILESATRLGLSQIFPPASHPNWLEVMERASRIKMFGISLNLVGEQNIQDSLTERLDKGEVEMTLILCDPRSLLLQIRRFDEPRGNPPDWKEGLRYQAAHIETLYNWRSKTLKKPKNLSLKLFKSYPTMALFSFDEELYFYPYVYGERGLHGPVFGTSGSNLPLVKFLKATLKRIEDDSIDLNDKENKDIQNKKGKGEFDDGFLQAKLTAMKLPEPRFDKKEKKR